MNDIDKLPCVTTAEIDKFRQHKIETIDDLWHTVGSEPPVSGTAKAILETGIDGHRFEKLYEAQSSLDNTDAIGKIAGIQAQELAVFSALNLHTIADLRHYLTSTEEWRGVRIVARRLGIPWERLRDLLLAQGLAEIEAEDTTWWRQNGTRVIGTAVFLLFLLLLLRSLVVSDWWQHLLGITERQAVVAKSDLPPYQVLTTQHVELRPSNSIPDDAFTETDKLVGRLLLVPISATTTITKDMVSETDWISGDLQDRIILPLMVQNHHVSNAAVPSSTVTLFFTGYMQGETAVPPLRIADVLLLTVTTGEDGVRLLTAVTPSDLDLIAPYLGQTSVVILQQVPNTQ